MSITHETATASPAAIGTAGGEPLFESNKKLDDVTNRLLHRQVLRKSSENISIAKKDPFAKYRLRQQQKQLQQQERRKQRQLRRKQHQREGLEQMHERNLAINSFKNDGKTNSKGEETNRKPDKGVETNSFMSPPNEGMTNLVLLRRQKRISDRGHPSSGSPPVTIKEKGSQQIENRNQIGSPCNTTGTATVASPEIHKIPTMNTHSTSTNSTMPSRKPNSYHFTNLSDGTPVYSSSPLHSMQTGDFNKDTAPVTIGSDYGDEAEEEKGNILLTQTDALITSQPSLCTNNHNQRGILSVNKSSDIPIAQSSRVSDAIDMKGSKAVATNSFDDQKYESYYRDKEMCQNENMAAKIDGKDTMDGDGFDLLSIPSVFSSSTSSLGIKTKADSNTSKHEKKGANNDDRCCGKEFVAEGFDAEEDTGASMKNGTNVNKTLFKDIIGHQSVKLRLDEVLLPLALPASLSQTILTGVRSLPASIFMYGPPGCGKTQLAKAVAGEANAVFLSIGPSDILSKYVGESEQAVRSVFAEAVSLARNNREGNKCTVLFFDEIDALGQSRGVGGVNSNGTIGEKGGIQQSGGYEQGSDNSSRRILAELLIQLTKVNTTHGTFDFAIETEREDRNEDQIGKEKSRLESREDDDKSGDSISSVETQIYQDDAILDEEDKLRYDGIESNSNEYDRNGVRVIVVAATNRPEDCDPALIRRFAVQVQVGLPDAKDRKKMLKRSMQEIEHTITKKQFSDLSLITDGWSGSDLQSLAREAAMAPVRECIRSAALLKRRRYLSNSFQEKKKKKIGQTPCGQEKNRGKANKGNKERPHDNCADNDGSYTGSTKRLLEEFHNLRAVNFRDFTKSLAFCFSRMYSNLHDSPLAEFGWIEECGVNCGTNGNSGLKEHYDSSSEEEEEEDDDDDEVVSTEDFQTQLGSNLGNRSEAN